MIVCETTGQLSPLLPVLVSPYSKFIIFFEMFKIALMVANAISSFLQPSIYESIINIKNYPHLAELPPSRIRFIKFYLHRYLVTLYLVYIH